MKHSFFQAAVVSIVLYGCTTWTLTKRLERKLDGNYTRMLRAILNKSGGQHPTRHQLYGHLLSITKTIQARRTRHAGHCRRSRDELKSDVVLWTPTYSRAQAGRSARTFSSYVSIRDVALNTCQRWWTIGRSDERGSGISVQVHTVAIKTSRWFASDFTSLLVIPFCLCCIFIYLIIYIIFVSIPLHLFIFLSVYTFITNYDHIPATPNTSTS